jgi:hypothetical protein
MAQRELTPGEQRYFTSITKVYSNNQMVRLKRRQYIDILNQELAKGKIITRLNVCKNIYSSYE